MCGEFHPKKDVERLYKEQNDGVRRLIGCEKCTRRGENRLGWCAKNSTEKSFKIDRILVKVEE